VPDLSKDDDCYAISEAYIPQNVTRQANLPPTDFTLIAIAPWISAECTLAYLSSALLDPTRAFIFYPPNNSTAQPPSPAADFWDLQDGGDWKTAYQFPVYAIPGAIGHRLMHQLALYSGNMTSVPYGHQISEIPNIDPRDYVRLYTQLSVSQVSTLPSLWVFLLVVLAALVLALGGTSASMHFIQRKRRKLLQRRVASGEVNLEALGIKRLTVPLEYIEQLPLFIYSAESEKSPPSSPRKSSHNTTDSNEFDKWSIASPLPILTPVGQAPFIKMTVADDSKSNHDSVIVHRFLPYSQPTCPICLEDYISGETEIRELPCGHIFHPDCIDTFLANNSSLCPMCKKSCLPVGICPTKITNAMVRRERNLRRIRSRVPVDEARHEVDLEAAGVRRRIKSLGFNLRRRALKRSSAEIAPAMPMQPQPVYMTSALPSNPVVERHSLTLGPSREEVVAQRIRELAATQVPIRDPDIMEENSRPRCELLPCLLMDDTNELPRAQNVGTCISRILTT
jgi:hypothetical protein